MKVKNIYVTGVHKLRYTDYTGNISPLGEGEDVFVEDFFVRNWGVGGARSTTLEEGEPVLYQVTRDEWGATAKNVCILRSSRSAVR